MLKKVITPNEQAVLRSEALNSLLTGLNQANTALKSYLMVGFALFLLSIAGNILQMSH